MAENYTRRGSELTNEDILLVYDDYPNLFSLEVHHGGRLTKPPRRVYVGGTVDYFDLIDIDRFSVHEIDDMINAIGYGVTELMFYQFLNPTKDLDDGLEDLGCDQDVLKLGKFVSEHKIIKVYILHGAKNIQEFYLSPVKPKLKLTIEEIDEPGAFAIVPLARNNMPAMEECPSSSTNPPCPSTTPIEDDPLFTELVNDHGNTDRESLDNDGDFEADIQLGGQRLDGESIDLDFSEEDNKAEVDNMADVSEEDNRAELDNMADASEEDNRSEESEEEDDEFIVDIDNSNDDDYEVDMRDFDAYTDREVVDQVGTENLNQNDHGEDSEGIEYIDNEHLHSASESDGNETKDRKHLLHRLRRGDEEEVDLYVGQEFGTKSDAKELVKWVSVQTRRKLKFLKDDKTRLRVVCEGDLSDFEVDDSGVHIASQVNEKGGKKGKSKRKGPATSSRKTSAKEKGKSKVKVGPVNLGGRGKKTNPQQFLCPFVLYVSKSKGSESWVVKTLNNVHKCLPSRSVRACTSTFLSQQMLEQMAENPDIPVNAVQEQFQRKFELGISKMKAYRARAKAKKEVEGDYSLQYSHLWNYANELRDKNPDTTVKIEVEYAPNSSQPTRQFKRIYVCFGALKQGFKALGRKLLGLDGAFMKGPYPGQILSAVGIDNNNGIYPLCYAVVESECFNSWTWFLNNLGDDLGLHTSSEFTFISDRQKGLLPALSKLYPNAEHRYCLRHIHENMKLTFRGKLYKDLLWKAATSTTDLEFKSAMDEVKKQSNDAYLWLEKIPPVHWSRSHFTGKAVSDVLLNNICEVFNGKISEGRDKPIISALEFIRQYLMRRIVTVMRVQEKHDGLLTPYATTMLEKIKKDATHYHVLWNGGDLYQVSGKPNHHRVVDLNRRRCSCRKWELTGLPCCHAVAALWFMASNGGRVGALESWANPIWTMESWKEVYSHKLNPINDMSPWEDVNVPNVLTPPKYHTPVGRPKKARKRSAIEMEELTAARRLSKKNQLGTCSSCGGKGHNKRT